MDVNPKVILCGIFLSVVMSFLSVHSVKVAKVPEQIMATFGAAKKKIDAETPGKTPGADILQKPSLDVPKNSVFDTGKTPRADILQPSYQKPSLDEPGMPTPKKALSVILAKPPSPEPPPRSPEKQDAAGTATWADIFPHSPQKAFPDPQLNAEAPQLDKKALSVILDNAQKQAGISGAATEAIPGNVQNQTAIPGAAIEATATGCCGKACPNCRDQPVCCRPSGSATWKFSKQGDGVAPCNTDPSQVYYIGDQLKTLKDCETATGETDITDWPTCCMVVFQSNSFGTTGTAGACVPNCAT